MILNAFNYVYFPRFYTCLLTLLCVCASISCHNISLQFFCLSVCYYLAKINKAGGPETLIFNFVWPYPEKYAPYESGNRIIWYVPLCTTACLLCA